MDPFYHCKVAFDGCRKPDNFLSRNNFRTTFLKRGHSLSQLLYFVKNNFMMPKNLQGVSQ